MATGLNKYIDNSYDKKDYAGHMYGNNDTDYSNVLKFNSDVPIGPSSDGMLVFNWDSEYRNNSMNEYKKQTERQLNVVNNMFTSNDNTELLDNNGKRIINIDENKLWFKEYVALIFSVGCIFNNNDREKLDIILRTFSNNETGFLMNYKKVASYKDELIKTIEKRMEIGNGNYHVCLITLVTTSDKNILAKAPEARYTVSGIIDKYCEWPEIFKFMNTIVSRYGLVTEQSISHDDKLSWEIGTEGLPVKTVRHTEVESSFDIDIDPDNESQIKLNAELEFMKEHKEIFNTRQLNTQMMRENKHSCLDPYRNRFIKNGSLYSRIQQNLDCGDVDNNIKDDHVGVQLRMNESITPPDKVTAEYQLYDDDNTYMNGRNIINISEASSREHIPVFRQTNVRGSKNRIVTNNPMRTLMNVKK